MLPNIVNHLVTISLQCAYPDGCFTHACDPDRFADKDLEMLPEKVSVLLPDSISPRVAALWRVSVAYLIIT